MQQTCCGHAQQSALPSAARTAPQAGVTPKRQQHRPVPSQITLHEWTAQQRCFPPKWSTGLCAGAAQRNTHVWQMHTALFEVRAVRASCHNHAQWAATASPPETAKLLTLCLNTCNSDPLLLSGRLAAALSLLTSHGHWQVPQQAFNEVGSHERHLCPCY